MCIRDSKRFISSSPNQNNGVTMETTVWRGNYHWIWLLRKWRSRKTDARIQNNLFSYLNCFKSKLTCQNLTRMSLTNTEHNYLREKAFYFKTKWINKSINFEKDARINEEWIILQPHSFIPDQQSNHMLQCLSLIHI